LRVANPLTREGLATLSGSDLGTALIAAATYTRQNQLKQQEEAEFQNQQLMQQKLRGIAQNADLSNPEEMFRQLVQAGVPIAQASALYGHITKQKRAMQQQQMMSQLFGG